MNTKRWSLIVLLVLALFHLTHAEEIDIRSMSLDSLLNIPVSAVSKYEQKSSEAPSSVTIITADDIKKFGYQTFDEILAGVRGFYINNDRNYSYLGVRGFGRPTDYNNRIKVLLNGCTLNDNIYNSSLLGSELALSLETIERLEIVRGPGSVIYGTGAMLTVINIITKDPTFDEGFTTVLKTGNFGKKQFDLTWSREFNNKLQIFVSGLWGEISGEDIYFKEYDTPETNNGIARNLDWDKYYGNFVHVSFNNFTLQTLFAQREKAVPTAAWGVMFNNPDSRVLDQRMLLELGYKRKLGFNSSLSGRIFLNSYKNDQTYPFDVNFYDDAEGRWYGSEWQYLWDVFSNLRVTGGLEYQNFYKTQYIYKTDNDIVFMYDKPQHLTALYVQTQYQPLHNLSFTLGVRHEDYNITSASTTPRIGIIFNPNNKRTFKLLYGKAYRIPDIYEKNYLEPDYQKVNYGLESEQITTTELVYEQKFSRTIYGILSIYDYSIYDLIELTLDNADSLHWYVNLGKTNARGIEMEFNGRYENGFSWYFNTSWQKAQLTENKIHISNSPELLLKAGGIAPVTSFMNAAVEFLYETARYTLTNSKSKAYFLTNASLNSNTFGQHFRINCTARNLFNVNYALPGGLEHEQDLIPQKGRTVTLGAEIKF
ncbi:MAG TPA: TonB-dependent receptor [bacterium]|nr:TonB-dependent receptor [bacterium]HPN42477.1 TonB-dependent receptor [bacterium]